MADYRIVNKGSKWQKQLRASSSTLCILIFSNKQWFTDTHSHPLPVLAGVAPSSNPLHLYLELSSWPWRLHFLFLSRVADIHIIFRPLRPGINRKINIHIHTRSNRNPPHYSPSLTGIHGNSYIAQPSCNKWVIMSLMTCFSDIFPLQSFSNQTTMVVDGAPLPVLWIPYWLFCILALEPYNHIIIV